MRRLEDRELVVSRPGSTLAGEREYLFKHILTRDERHAEPVAQPDQPLDLVRGLRKGDGRRAPAVDREPVALVAQQCLRRRERALRAQLGGKCAGEFGHGREHSDGGRAAPVVVRTGSDL